MPSPLAAATPAPRRIDPGAMTVADRTATLRATPPALALGIFERVGSNWLSDTLRAVMPQHNEPFRQQLSRQHPLTPGDRVPTDLTTATLPPLGLHHLACALDDLYGEPRHLVKETNLYFATSTVLRLLPASPVLVLTRAPLGITSSFQRGNLWDRWRYPQRYTQLSSATSAPHWRHYAPLLPADNPATPTAMGRLIALNALLVADALHRTGRQALTVSYEDHVRRPQAILDSVTRHLGLAPLRHPKRDTSPPGGSTSVFATTQDKQELTAQVEPSTALLLGSAVQDTLNKADDLLPDAVLESARIWTSGDDLYELRKPPARRTAARTAKVPSSLPKPHFVPASGTGVMWRNLLITNEEMADLLTMMDRAGLPNTLYGTNLLVCPMPHERGGRLHFDAAARRWKTSPGHETQPAYWVTWLGAVVMAAWGGARLPTRAEAVEMTAGRHPANYDYRIGDTCHVAESGLMAGEIHHAVGNVQVWCNDGPDLDDRRPLQRYLTGAAWNTPGDRGAVEAVRSRYLLGSSRGVGIRLVRDAATGGGQALGAWELAKRINRWIEDVNGGPAMPPGQQDRRLLDALALS